MRLGEILALTWNDVQWIDRIIRIPDSKNDEVREVAFTGELESILREQHAKREPNCPFVCYRWDSSAMLGASATSEKYGGAFA